MIIAEVISSISGFGFPGENFIPLLYYSGRGRLCKAEIQVAFLTPIPVFLDFRTSFPGQQPQKFLLS